MATESLVVLGLAVAVLLGLALYADKHPAKKPGQDKQHHA